jgi:peptidoglycan/xylan/chitin deacetylase (PgdA/CDA1 family)
MKGPAISVVIASHNRARLLGRCLDALAAQNVDPSEFEVIVADDGSSDETPQLLERLQTPFRLRVLRLAGSGQASAQNAAIEIAEGEVCLFLDDDVIASPELVAGHLAAHRANERMIGVGRLTQQAPDARDWYAHEFAASWNRHYDELGEQPLDWIGCFGGNLSAPRAALNEVGGFATDLRAGDDIELSFRLQRSGCTPRYLPQAGAVHDDQKRSAQMLADCKRQGASGVELARLHQAMTPKLLGWFGATSPREQVLRRLLIAMRAPPRLLAGLGRLMPGGGRRQIWFQFVSRFAFWRAVRTSMSREQWVRTTHGVPVLMYHAFSERDASDRYVVSRRTLKRQMQILSLLRFRAIGFEELAQTLRDGELPPARSFAITIDDGYRDNLEIAQPILERHGFAATIFLISGRIGGVCDWTEREALHGRPLLSAKEISGLLGSTTTFGAHTRTHCSLPDARNEDVIGEIAGSRGDLEEQLGVPVQTFAYPYGRFDERALAAVREAGFAGAGTVVPRRAQIDDDPLQIPRIEVRAEDSLPRFVFKLWFGGA